MRKQNHVGFGLEIKLTMVTVVSNNLTIKLLDKDIIDGVVGNLRHCPIAKAMNRAMDDPQGRLKLHKYYRWVWEGRDKHERVIIPLPQEAISFMRTFDIKMKAEPIEFTVVILKGEI